MAKQTQKIIQLSGKVEGIVFVTSKVYGNHTRAPRGTIKPAVLNATVQQHAGITSSLNQQAKQVHDQLKLIAGSFKQSGLWQVLLKRMRAGRQMDTAGLLQTLTGLELNSRHPLHRLANAGMPVCLPEATELVCTQQLSLATSKATSYKQWLCSLVILFFDEAGSCCGIATAAEALLNATSGENISGRLPVPASARYWLSCLQVQAFAKGEIVGNLSSTGMKVNGMGEM